MRAADDNDDIIAIIYIGYIVNKCVFVYNAGKRTLTAGKQKGSRHTHRPIYVQQLDEKKKNVFTKRNNAARARVVGVDDKIIICMCVYV